MATAGLELLGFGVLGLHLGALGVLAVFGAHRWLLLAQARRPLPPPATSGGPLPRVTVQIPVFNEPQVAERVTLAACRLDYPTDRLEIQVLDDSTDGTSRRIGRVVRAARRAGLSIAHRRRRHRRGYKAGALAAGLATASGELIAVFDADFVPPPDFLRRLVPEFRDRRVGMVQARWGHLNRKAGWLTRAQAALLDGHFLVDHVARASAGRFFNFNGTAGVWRRACIDAAGGWRADTLTEDLDLSYRAQLAGWRFVYRPDVVVPGELPATLAALRSQQYRWAKGSIQTARKLLPRIARSRCPVPTRIEAAFHLTENAAYVCLVVLTLLTWPVLVIRQGAAEAWWSALDLAVLGAAWLPVLASYYTSQRRSGERRGRSLLSIPSLMALGIGMALNNGRAVVSGLLGRCSPFERTPKDGGTDAVPAVGPPPPPPERWLTPLAEAVFALYLTVTLADAAARGAWPWVPFIVLFLCGFAATGAGGLAGAWRRRPAGRGGDAPHASRAEEW